MHKISTRQRRRKRNEKKILRGKKNSRNESRNEEGKEGCRKKRFQRRRGWGKTPQTDNSKLPIQIGFVSGTNNGTQVGKSAISPISKFSYLKELLSPKARVLINVLPFTTEGYERAKCSFNSKFGKSWEVAKAHIKFVVSLLVINNLYPERVHSFYEKLITSIQSLESVGKSQYFVGFVRHTLGEVSICKIGK